MTPPANLPARKHRILVADDHALVREGIGKVLALGGDDLVVAAQATTAAEVLATLQRGEIDLVLLDLLMPGAKDVDLIRRLAAAHPKLPILVLTMHGGARPCAGWHAGPRQRSGPRDDRQVALSLAIAGPRRDGGAAIGQARQLNARRGPPTCPARCRTTGSIHP